MKSSERTVSSILGRRARAVVACGLLAPSLASGAACVAPDAATCEPSESCGDCTRAGSGCGFCASTGTCVAGSSLGPASGSCDAWEFSSCTLATITPPTEDAGTSVDCTSLSACGGCTAASCTWCGNGAGGGTCIPNNSGGSCTGMATAASQCSAVSCFQSGATCAQNTDCCSASCTPADPTSSAAGGTCQ